MTKKAGRAPWAGFAALLVLVSGCQFPYSPKIQPDPVKEQVKINDSTGIGGGYLYPVNTNQQTCNPSISQSGVYPACMLWLGFEQVSVKVPDSLNGYGVTNVHEHDRLTIVDTVNTVRWYIMLSDFNRSGEFQCPEWSTHPDYIACLIGTITQPYSGYAVRLSDKKSLKLCDGKLEEFSTPHFWLPDSAVHGSAVAAPFYDSSGFVIKDQVRQFFGTTQFKFVYTLLQKGGTLYYVDYSVSGNPAPVPLQKPEGLESWYCHSPLISPDGGWVTYHCFPNSAQGAYYRSFIQRLSPDAKPVFIADKASDPHWWVDRGGSDQYYIVYTVTNGSYFSEYDYSDQSIEKSGNAGATLVQRLKGAWRDVPGFLGTLSPDDLERPYTLIHLPFKGGLSRDGDFLCTAYKYAYLLRLK
jgi:hypothetical protein